MKHIVDARGLACPLPVVNTKNEIKNMTEGESVEVKTGAALFATRTGAPLLPVYIQPQKRWFRRNTVVIGQPYYPEFEGRKPTADELQSIAEDLMGRVRTLGEGQKWS